MCINIISERFNETIFDALSSYVLDICQVCGSSQCPYCWIYNTGANLPVPMLTILFTGVLILMRNMRLDNGVII